MAEPGKIEVPLSIKWDKKSKKVGQLLERLAEVVELEAERRAEERLDEAWDTAYREGYNDALRMIRQVLDSEQTVVGDAE